MKLFLVLFALIMISVIVSSGGSKKTPLMPVTTAKPEAVKPYEVLGLVSQPRDGIQNQHIVADILFKNEPTDEKEIFAAVTEIAGKHDSGVIRVYCTRAAYDEREKQISTGESKRGLIGMFFRAKSKGTNEFRWLQEIGNFKSKSGEKTKL